MSKKRRKQKGTVLIRLGILMIAAAVLFAAYNLYDNYRAQNTSQEVMGLLEAALHPAGQPVAAGASDVSFHGIWDELPEDAVAVEVPRVTVTPAPMPTASAKLPLVTLPVSVGMVASVPNTAVECVTTAPIEFVDRPLVASPEATEITTVAPPTEMERPTITPSTTTDIPTAAQPMATEQPTTMPPTTTDIPTATQPMATEQPTTMPPTTTDIPMTTQPMATEQPVTRPPKATNTPTTAPTAMPTIPVTTPSAAVGIPVITLPGGVLNLVMPAPVETESPSSTPVPEVEIPDYVLNPNMKMPVKRIDGQDYIGILEIPALELKLPVISEWTYLRLKIAPCRYTGSAYTNDLVIAAHNYASHFGNLSKLFEGAAVIFTDMDGNVFNYRVDLKETLGPYDIEYMQAGDWALTLFTCTPGGSYRVAIRCVAAFRGS